MDENAVAVLAERVVRTHERFRGGSLEKSPRLVVEDTPHEVVRGGIAHVEPNGGIERDRLDELGLAKISLVFR